ncbi:MAG: hypothetical protein GY730_03795 [bacterium]|nr:hypothetical protein [bacterium]
MNKIISINNSDKCLKDKDFNMNFKEKLFNNLYNLSNEAERNYYSRNILNFYARNLEGSGITIPEDIKELIIKFKGIAFDNIKLMFDNWVCNVYKFDNFEQNKNFIVWDFKIKDRELSLSLTLKKAGKKEIDEKTEQLRDIAKETSDLLKIKLSCNDRKQNYSFFFNIEGTKKSVEFLMSFLVNVKLKVFFKASNDSYINYNNRFESADSYYSVPKVVDNN